MQNVITNEWLARPLSEKYITKDGKHLKFVRYYVEYSGDNQYIGAVQCMTLNKNNRCIYYTVACDNFCNSEQDAFNFCSKVGQVLMHTFKNNLCLNNVNEIYKLMKEKGFVRYKSRN